jgi:hypothetical protein
MNENSLLRWRYILGKFDEKNIQTPMNPNQARLELALDYLYSREYAERGMRSETKDEGGSLEDSQISIPYWLSEVRELFPIETCEIIEIHALERYGMTELVTDPKVLEKLTPNEDLLKTILTFRGLMTGEVLGVARKIIKEVVEEIKRKLENEIRQTLAGKLNRFQHSPLKVSQNFDCAGQSDEI